MTETKQNNDNLDTSKNKNILHFSIVAILFLLSGLSSLIYQVIWTRQLVFVFGSTTFASSTVLSVFMGGLALGSFVAGRYSDRMPKPFLWYGILEGIIGVWALLIPFFLDASIPLYKSIWQSLHLSALPFALIRFLVVSLILLPPTACMGATLPLLSRFVSTNLAQVSSRVGTLYAINTFGAVIGAVAAGFFMIPNFGLSITTNLAATINILLTASVVTLSKSWKEEAKRIEQANELATDIEQKNKNIDKNTNTKIPLSVLSTIIAFGISGGLAMVYEVAWTRSLLMVIGSTTYAFSVMLSTFLIGIFIGSLVASRFSDRAKKPLIWFALIQIFIAASSILSISLFNYLPYWNLIINRQYASNPEAGMFIRFLLAGSILIPITIFLGASFPFAVRICTRQLENLGRSVGTLYSINTLGAILGSFIAGFFIIPLLGSEKSMTLAAFANLGLGAAILVQCQSLNLALRLSPFIPFIGLFIWTIQDNHIWDHNLIINSQKQRRNLLRVGLPNTFEEWKKQINANSQVSYWKEGLSSNVAVVRINGNENCLLTNGHIDASDGPIDMSTQCLLPSISLLINPKIKTVGNIGWGSGTTLGYALLFPIEKLICAELEQAVVDTSKFFHTVNLAPEKDRRLDLQINDGRNYMLATDEMFDLIISEPSNPWQAGVCNLYTEEYFKVCHDRLKPGGIFTMWWQFNEVTSDNLCRVFAAIKKSFKHILVFTTCMGDISAVASDEPLKLNLKTIKNSLEELRPKGILARYGTIFVPEDLAAKICIASDTIDKAVENVTPNTDDKNHIEYNVAKTYEQQNFTADNLAWMIKNFGNPWDNIDWTGYTQSQKAEKLALIAERAMVQNQLTAELWAAKSYKTEANAFALCVLALYEAQKKGNFDQALAFATKAVTEFPQEDKAHFVRGLILLIGGAPHSAQIEFLEALKLKAKDNNYSFWLAHTYMPDLRKWYQQSIIDLPDTGTISNDPKKVLEILTPLNSDGEFCEANPAIMFLAAMAHIKLNHIDEAIPLLSAYLKVRPSDLVAWRALSSAYTAKNNEVSASFCQQKASQIAEAQSNMLCQNAARLYLQSKDFLCLGFIKKAIDLFPSCRPAREILWKLAERYEPAESYMTNLANLSEIDAKALQMLKAKKIK